WVAQVCGTSEQMIFRHYRRWMPALSRADGRRIAALFGPPTPPPTPRRGHQDGHRRDTATAKALKSQRAESGGGGNRTPLRRGQLQKLTRRSDTRALFQRRLLTFRSHSRSASSRACLNVFPWRSAWLRTAFLSFSSTATVTS